MTNAPKTNLVKHPRRQAKSSEQTKPAKAAKQKLNLPWAHLALDSAGGMQVVSTALGELAVQIYGDIQTQPTVSCEY